MDSGETVAREGPHWYGVRVRSRSEPMAAAMLDGQGYAPFLPTYKVCRKWTDRTRQIDTPLFPGYVFCRFDPQRILPILMTPGVLGIVGFGKVPAPIEEREIDAIRAVVAAGLRAEPLPFMHEGDRVEIIGGPLCGMEGIVGKFRNNQRLILSVTMLQRSVSVEVDPNWIRRMN